MHIFMSLQLVVVHAVHAATPMSEYLCLKLELQFEL